MNILFTKKLEEDEVVKVLGTNITADYVEVIKINLLNCTPFPLANKSLIFTSVNGVESFFKNGFKPHENFAEKNFNKVYCVGQKTKLRLRKYGFGVFKTKKNAKELSEFIIENCGKEKFLHFCGNLALDILQEKLPLQNIDYKKIVVYETQLVEPVVNGHYDAVAFFSPSGVRSFLKNNTLNFEQIFAIGETTAAEISKYTTQKIFIGKDNDLSALLKLIKKEGKL